MEFKYLPSPKYLTVKLCNLSIQQSLLLLWQNNPCVVIGRHQNPWTEANVPYIRGSDTMLARRNRYVLCTWKISLKRASLFLLWKSNSYRYNLHLSFIFVSGGGTVYHDLGNMNCTFFTRKSAYDRRRNLDVVCKAIQSMSQAINVRINDRDDIVVNSGTNPENDKKVQ